MADEQKFTLSNFRKEDVFEDWPLGFRKRCTATFIHESNKRGQRIGRQTTGKIKYSTYYKHVCLADGSDGKVHYIGWTEYGFLSVMAGDMKYQDHAIFAGEDNFDEYKKLLFDASKVS